MIPSLPNRDPILTVSSYANALARILRFDLAKYMVMGWPNADRMTIGVDETGASLE
jgi:hypothetical protein